MRKMQEYKQTEIGRIPGEWEISRVDEIFNSYGGTTPSTSKDEYWNGDILWVTPSDVTKLKGRLNLKKTEKKITTKAIGECSLRVFEEGTLLLTSRATIGFSVINARPVTINQGMTALLPKNNEIIHTLFYSYYFQRIKPYLEQLGSGSTFREVSRSTIKKLKIPLPPLPEQKKIAEVLSTVDQGIEKADEAIEKTKRLKKGLMQELLTNGIGHKEFMDTEIGRIPKEWMLICLKEIAEVRYGLGQPPPQDEKGIPMIRATNIKQGRITANDMMRINREDIPKTRNPFLKEGDVIVVRSGAYTGDIGYITKTWEGTIAGYDLVVSPSNRILSLFLSNWLLSRNIQSEYFFKFKERSAQPHLNSSQVENTPIPLPPLPEQKKIASILGTVDERLDMLRKRKEKLRRIRQGLMNDLLIGRKRLRVEV